MTEARAEEASCYRHPATRRSACRVRRGFALEATLFVLLLTSILVAVALTWVTSVTRTAGLDYRGSRVSYGAEAGADAIMSQLEIAMEDGVLTDAELDALVLPELTGFDFADMDVARAGEARVRPITSGPYAGLYALSQPVNIRLTAADSSRNESTVDVTVNAVSIPLFQFGVFYEKDLEIHNGPLMTFRGWVHTNGNLYLSSNASVYQSQITTPSDVVWNRKSTNDRMYGVDIADASGTPRELSFDSRSLPNPADFRAASDRDFDGRLMTSAYGVTRLNLPLPTGMEPIELIRPRNAGDVGQVRDVKFAWKADWHIVVDANQLANVCVSGAMTHTRVGLVPPTLLDCALIFRGASNAFNEGREQTGVDVLDIDIGALRSWSLLSLDRPTEILYVTFVNVNNGDADRDFPAVRLHNGSRLPNPLSIATDRPLYVRGNYNNSSGNWQPASLLADAITFLSSRWSDGSHPWVEGETNNFSKRTADPMSVYAAIAAGHSATPCDYTDGSCSPASPPPFTNPSQGPNYGGGFENFPRFLENWGGVQMLYRGSLVSLFESEYAARRRWQWRDYYSAPNRNWEFDIRFEDPRNLPPGTPNVGSVVQKAFRPVY